MNNIVTTIIICTLISFIPILGWLYFFQKQNHEKRSYVILTFLAGMFSVAPMKLYEKYWDVSILYFEHINIFKYIADLTKMPTLPKLFSFIAVNSLVAFLFFFFVAFVMFLFEVISRDNTPKVFRAKMKKIYESPFIFISVGVLCGVLAYTLSLSLSQKVWFFIIVGILEEYIKHLVLRFSDEEKIGTVDDAISFAVVAALGFSFVENVLYLFDFLDSSARLTALQIIVFLSLRSVVSAMAHVCFSGIFGYFYGIAHFAKEVYQYEAQRSKMRVLSIMHKILHLKPVTIFKEEKMMEGMLIAIITHAVYNSFLEMEQYVLIIPSTGFLFLIVLNLFHRVFILKQTSAVHQTTNNF